MPWIKVDIHHLLTRFSLKKLEKYLIDLINITRYQNKMEDIDLVNLAFLSVFGRSI